MKILIRVFIICFFLLCLLFTDAAVEHVVVLTKSNFDSVVDGSKVVFAEFYAPWCGHCKSLEPVWEQFGKAFADEPRIVIAKIDATVETQLAERFNIKGYPTLHVFKKGSTDSIPYEGGRSIEDLVLAANKLCGTNRKTDGSLDNEFGTVFEIREKLAGVTCKDQSFSECVSRFHKTVRDENAGVGQNSEEDELRAKCTKYYEAALMKLQTNQKYLSTEMNRLEQLVNTSSVSDEVKTFMLARINILSELRRMLKERVSKSEVLYDEL